MAKSKEKIKARIFRKSGKSIKWIAHELSVSPGSVSLWCRDVKLTQEQIKQLEKQGRDPYYGKRLENVLKQQQIRIDKTRTLNLEGEKLVGEMNKRELLLVGIALYWAEGYKKDNQAGLGSSDPEMVLMVVKWLVECFGYSKDDLIFRVTVNESHEYRIKEIVQYWAKLLDVDEGEFRKPFYQKVKWKKVYENPGEYYGVLRIRVRRSADFLRKVHGMIDGMKREVL
jgi:hypothetical protein